jgi:hypothetical protein
MRLTRDLARLRGRARSDLLLWLVRALWAALPFTVGPTLAAWLEGASRPVQLVASGGLWAGWALGTVATFVPLPVALTTIRVLSPGALAVALAAAVAGHPSALAVAWAAVACAWTFAPSLGSRCVNGPAYPNERRFLLRAPGTVLRGPLVLAWALGLAGAAAGPLLLAAHRWVLGGVALAAGWPAAWLLLRSLHNLSRRWTVFVPAGMVLHDPLTLVDPVLFRRQDIVGIRPATSTHGSALDVSQRAPGLALQLELAQPTNLALVRPGQRLGRSVEAGVLRFTPTRPGAVLEEAHRRRLGAPGRVRPGES